MECTQQKLGIIKNKQMQFFGPLGFNNKGNLVVSGPTMENVENKSKIAELIKYKVGLWLTKEK